MKQIVTEAAARANTIGAHDHPVLEEGSLSFPRGRYVLRFAENGKGRTFEIMHQVENAALISRLVKERKAKYGCIVSSPRSFYRKLHVSELPRQRIEWDDRDLGEPPLFTPLVLCTDAVTLDLDAERDQVHGDWNGLSVTIPKGARLALGHVFDLRSSLLQLIRMEVDDKLDGNRFYVDARTEPFGFVVKASPALHAFVRTAGAHPIRSNIMTHVVTACFALLQRHFKDPDQWDRSLERLAALVKDKYAHTWADEDFRPEMAATALYPHKLPDAGDAT